MEQIVVGLLALIQALALFIINRLYKKYDLLTQEVKDVRSNYLSQFAKLNDSLRDIQVTLAKIGEHINNMDEKFSELKTMLLRHDNSINALKFAHAKQHDENLG